MQVVKDGLLPGLQLLRPQVITDERGFFVETFAEAKMRAAGFDVAFVQDNHSRSSFNTVRGLHFQRRAGASHGQAKLVRCARGTIWDVVVDIRPYSATFRQWQAFVLDDDKHEMLFIPTGFAHGFCVLSELADVCYRVSTPYAAATEDGISCLDPTLGIRWPIDLKDATLSPRDRAAKTLAEIEDSLWQW
jgi:dTDP-4-dehydrorhamnose 3,5-epimerase